MIPGQASSAVALARPRFPLLTCLFYHLLIAKALGRLRLLFTGQAQIRFLTTPPGLLCQGKLALQNCSPTGKCVRLFISHSHWKKGGGEGLVLMSFFPQNLSMASHVTATSRQYLGFSAQHLWNRANQGSQFLFLLPLCLSITPGWDFYSLGNLKAALERNLSLQVRNHFLDISRRSKLQLGKYFGGQ